MASMVVAQASEHRLVHLDEGAVGLGRMEDFERHSGGEASGHSAGVGPAGELARVRVCA
jgi:hypothetical protein